MAGSAIQMREVLASEECWALLERIAASPQLRRATRLQELLYYLGKRSLKDHCETLHEQTVGVEVFGRPDGYDTSADNIVRTSVSELRKRIDGYFSAAGAGEALIMEIPRWNYVPVFKHRPIQSAPIPEIPVVAEPVAMEIPDSRHPEVQSGSVPAQRGNFALVAACTLAILFGFGCLFFLIKYQSASARYETLHRSLFAWQYEPSVAEFWTSFLSAKPDTDIVLADASFGLLQDINKKSFSFDDYLSHSYVSELQARHLSPDLHAVLGRIAVWNLGSPDEFMLARRILALDPMGQNIHLYSARNYMAALTKRDNVILIGGNISNPWDDLFEGRMNFTAKFEPDGSIMVANRAPANGERSIYSQTDSVQYCVVSYLPNPDHSGVVMLIEGTDAEATEAAGDFLMSEEQLSSFKRLLHVEKFPYFEVLLKVSSVPGTPLTASVEAYRTYPSLD
jgi:hypothetical protein